MWEPELSLTSSGAKTDSSPAPRAPPPCGASVYSWAATAGSSDGSPDGSPDGTWSLKKCSKSKRSLSLWMARSDRRFAWPCRLMRSGAPCGLCMECSLRESANRAAFLAASCTCDVPFMWGQRVFVLCSSVLFGALNPASPQQYSHKSQVHALSCDGLLVCAQPCRYYIFSPVQYRPAPAVMNSAVAGFLSHANCTSRCRLIDVRAKRAPFHKPPPIQSDLIASHAYPEKLLGSLSPIFRRSRLLFCRSPRYLFRAHVSAAFSVPPGLRVLSTPCWRRDNLPLISPPEAVCNLFLRREIGRSCGLSRAI